MDTTGEQPLKSIKRKDLHSAMQLLNRLPDAAYIDECTELLARAPKEEEPEMHSVNIFRLGSEWLAIATHFCAEVLPFKQVYPMPHRKHEAFEGLVSHQGQLTLCVDMHKFLSVPKEDTKERGIHKLSRTLLIQSDQEKWAFAVDEIFGVYRYPVTAQEPPPATILHSRNNFLRGMIMWEHHHVGCIDEELLFYSLRRSLI